MTSSITYPYGALHGTCQCRVNAKLAAYLSAIYALSTSILVVLLYMWRLGQNVYKYGDLEDVYYGVQIAYLAIIGTQSFMVVLSALLFYGVWKENSPLVVPWIIGCITFMSLEAMAMVYSNVLRDHVNKHFDLVCKAEVVFYVTRALFNMLSIWGVIRFYHLIKSGVTWRGIETIEL